MTSRLTAALAFTVISLFGATTWAQNTFCAEEASCTTAISSTSAMTILGIGATTMSRIRNRRVAALDRYLRNNRLAVLGAAALGAGSALDDLATLAALPPERWRRFARGLRRERFVLRRGFERNDDSGYLRAVELVLAIAESPRLHGPENEEN